VDDNPPAQSGLVDRRVADLHKASQKRYRRDRDDRGN
jgi:hypothetical protein